MTGSPVLAAFTHFEARQTHSIALTPDKKRLLAVNSMDARLSVYDVSDASNIEPVLIAEIPVGMEPVAVAARTSDEVWVVNEVSDSISIVSLSRRNVVATLPAADEPSDVVFAQGKAFVSCARNKMIRVFDVQTRAQIAEIPVAGIEPRALAVDAMGSKVYVAFLMSGNQTTILPSDRAPLQPPPTNIGQPAPRVALIVAANDSRINYTVLDHDVAQIDASTHAVDRYLSGAGNSLLDLAVHPQTGELWVANIDPKNLVRFEPVLKGHIADHRLTKFDLGSGGATHYDLNPGVDYGVLPNPDASSKALSEPRAIVFSDGGAKAWVAAFASDRIACIDTQTGQITSRVDVRLGSASARNMRGPRSLALKSDFNRLYVLNKLSNSITIVNTVTSAVMGEVPIGSYNPMPTVIREGRGFLYDARLSGNGTMSCATCHLDADRDGIAWDLGDPGGQLVTVMGANISAHDPTPRERVMHPMKGPMTTQTLRGMANGAPFHWRGDRAQITNFNVTFHALMAGDELPQADIEDMQTYLLSIRMHANPNLLRSGSPPTMFQDGFPTVGRDKFGVHLNHCGICHEGDRGTNNNIDLASEVGSFQPIKTPSLHTVYQRQDFNPRAGQTSLSGYGMNHDGTGFTMPIGHPYVLSELKTLQDFLDVRAYVLCFPTGTPPAVGTTFTVTPENRETIEEDILEMESLATEEQIDFTVRGLMQGRPVSYVYDWETRRYHPNSSQGVALSRSQLLEQLDMSDILNFMGTPAGEGERFAKDRNENNVPDEDEPPPELKISATTDTTIELEWTAAPEGWTLEQSGARKSFVWEPVTGPRLKFGPLLRKEEPVLDRKLYRLRRTW